MTSSDASHTWIALAPELGSAGGLDRYVRHAKALAGLTADEARQVDAINALDRATREMVMKAPKKERHGLFAACLILTDLVRQGWSIRVRGGVVEGSAQRSVDGNQHTEKDRIRQQELVKRDAQLREPAVTAFVRLMEKTRVHGDHFVSIFSLMRDGRELSTALRRVRDLANSEASEALARVTDPYLQFVRSETDTCEFTGLRLMDVWRYFRHTWSNQYTSVPGRSMAFLVRDRAASHHPVVGIGAISSPVVQIEKRDAWIGWHPATFLAHVRTMPSAAIARWLHTVVETAITEIYVDDLLEDEVITRRSMKSPTNADIQRLLAESTAKRDAHSRYVRSKDFKPTRGGETDWIARARSHLFRSKRAIALATMLQAKAALRAHFGTHPTAPKLAAFAASTAGANVLRKILKKAKADRIGISVADITVCGAIQPYNAILGGKLVAMLAATPEVVVEYRRRYGRSASEIASSMAGRPIIRKPTLVLLGTTSLYSVGSSQYNRVVIPCERIGGKEGDQIRYEELGRSQAYGTSQFSDSTVAALADFVAQSDKGQRVNSIFGEGVSPRLRKVREGLDLLSLPSDTLLRHNRQRIVYAVRLVENLRDYLLGLSANPKYRYPLADPASTTSAVVSWWRERWVGQRIKSDRVLEQVGQHTLVRPVRHGARVLAVADSQRALFEEVD